MATIRSVARAAGVSIATVSRVFNNSSLVSADTATRVLQVASDLDYSPNRAAQSLTTRRTATFGVLLPDLYGEFYSEVIRGLDQQARLHGYQILLSSSQSNGEDILAASRAMLGRIDGLVMMAPDEASIDTAERVRRRVPVVLLNPRVDVPRCSSVGFGNAQGAAKAVEHLLALGHRDIAMIAGPEGNADAEERLTGFRGALAAAGLNPLRALVVPGNFRETAGFDAGRAILAHPSKPTAVFAANDSMAIGLLAALRAEGCLVPRDMAVIGFDNVVISRYLNPALTTVHVDACGLGRRAVDLMLGSMEAGKETACRREILPAALKIRQSCGARPSTDENDFEMERAGSGE